MPVDHTVLVLCWLAVSARKETKDTQVITIYHERLGSEEKKIPGRRVLLL